MREAGGLCVRVCANVSLRTLCGFVRSRACLCALDSVYLHLFVEVFLCVCVCVRVGGGWMEMLFMYFYAKQLC